MVRQSKKAKTPTTGLATTPCGRVHLERDGRSLRLRFTWEGKRRAKGLGLRDSVSNQLLALQIAQAIANDMEIGRFDETLRRYLLDQTVQRDLLALMDERLAKQFNRADVGARTRLEKWGKAIRDRADAQDFANWIAKDVTAGTVRRYISIYSCIAPDLFKDLKLPKQTKPEPRAYTRDEVERILQYFKTSIWHDFVLCLFHTGMRLGEVTALRWVDVDFKGGMLRVSRSVAIGKGGKAIEKCTKTGKSRSVPISPQLQEVLKNRYSAQDPNDLVFSGKDGGYMKTHTLSANQWRSALKKAGIEFDRFRTRPYQVRHTFISHALEAGMSVVEVAAITGHSANTLLGTTLP